MENKYTQFNNLVKKLYNEEIEQIGDETTDEIKIYGNIKIEPQLLYDRFTREMKVEFKLGNKVMYKLKNLPEFYTRMTTKEYYKYGKKLAFMHCREQFEENSRPILDFIMRHAEIIKYTNSTANSNFRYYGKALSETAIILSNSGLDEFFEANKNTKISCQGLRKNEYLNFIDENPNLYFELKQINENEYKIEAEFNIYDITIFNGKKSKYILKDDQLYRCSKEFENTNLNYLIHSHCSEFLA